jgi:hypothetical protein
VEQPGRYLVWSDIPNNRQLRWLEDDGRVSVFRSPSNNSNGNTFDFQNGSSPASTSCGGRFERTGVPVIDRPPTRPLTIQSGQGAGARRLI